MDDLERTLKNYKGITLSELDKINLSDRQDYKSVFPDSLLPQFLEQLLPYYRVLDMNGRRAFQYESVYFDTPDLKSYQDHQRGKARRNKFRFRRYVDCGDSFFEIKTRSGKGRTLKTRIPANGNHAELTSSIKEIISAKVDADPEALVQSLMVTVTRITLLHQDNSEKVTFDYDIEFALGGKTKHLQNLVIAEVKQMRHSPDSDFFNIQRQLGIYPVSFSKYCIGIASLSEKVKTNNFKQNLLRIRNISG